MLSDLELIKRIAEINKDSIMLMKSALGTKYMSMGKGHDGYREYNPLTDDALCLQLIIKFRLEIWEVQGRWYVGFPDFSTITDDCLKKAVCLALYDAFGDTDVKSN